MTLIGGFGYYPKLRMERHSALGQSLYRDSTVNRVEWKHFVMERVARHYIPKIHVAGKKHLAAFGALEEREVPRIILPNHNSHADTVAISSMLEREGYRSMADGLVNYLGIRLLKLRFVNKMLDSYSYIPVWPPTEKPVTKEARRIAYVLTRNAVIATDNNVSANRTHCLNMEGGRSYSGSLKELEEVCETLGHQLYRIPNLTAIALGIVGTDIVLPQGKAIPRKSDVEMNVGEPFLVRDLADETLPKHEMYAKLAHDVVNIIADLLPCEYKQAYVAAGAS